MPVDFYGYWYALGYEQENPNISVFSQALKAYVPIPFSQGGLAKSTFI